MASDTSTTDRGAIEYAPLNVTSVSTAPLLSSVKNYPSLSAVAIAGTGKVAITLGETFRGASSLEVFNLSGTRVGNLSSTLHGSPGTITWDAKQNRVSPGMYVLRVKTGNISASIQCRVVE
jgi:hypothetical protein